MTFQYLDDRVYRVPVSRSDRHADLFLQFTEATEYLHLASIQSQHESISNLDNLQKPLAIRWEAERNRRNSSTSGQHAHEANDVLIGVLIAKRIGGSQIQDLAVRADHYLRVEGKPSKQLGAEPGLTDWFANDERAGRANVNHIKLREFFSERAGPESFVPAHIDASHQNDQCHRLTSDSVNRLGG